MTDTNVTINGKRGCSDTGITEELATKLFVSADVKKVTELVAIVRFKTETTHKAADGSTRKVDLSIVDIEPVVDGKLNGALVEHVREIQQALFRNRKLGAGKDEALPFGEEDGPAPKVADLVQQGKAFVETDEDTGEVTGIHQGDNDAEDTPEEPDDQAEPDDEPGAEPSNVIGHPAFSGT